MTWTKKKLNNLFFFCGIAAVIIMLFTFDVSFIELWQHLCRAGYWLIPIIGVWIIIYAINALSWMCIIQSNKSEDEHVSFWRIFKLTITGYALNYATPVGGLGGEPYRIMELSKDIDKRNAASSVILYAMMHIFAHFWFWFSSIFIYLALVLIGDMPLTTATAIVLGIIAVFCLIAFYLFSKGYRNGLVIKIIKLIGKIPGLGKWSRRMLTEHGESLHNIDTQIAALHQQGKRHFYCSLLLEYFSRVVQSLEIMFMLLLFGIDNGGDGRPCANLPPLHTHTCLHHPLCQPHRLPANADRSTGRRLRYLHRGTRSVRRTRHIRQHHLPREGDYMDSYRHTAHKDGQTVKKIIA